MNALLSALSAQCEQPVIARLITREQVEEFERGIYAAIESGGPVVEEEIPVVNHFGPGVYMREMILRAGQFAVGHAHRTEHFNILLSGTIRVCTNGRIIEVTGPRIILSPAGEKKIGVALTDCRWLTIHPTTETDIAKIEDSLVEKNQAWHDHQEKRLQSGGPTSCH